MVLDLPPELATPTEENKKALKAHKLHCPMYSPTEFTEGGRKSKADSVLIHFGVLDLDHITMDAVAEFVLTAQSQGIEILLYTTFSHVITSTLGEPENVSIRAMFPFSRPVPAALWSAFWPRMNAYLGGYGDTQCCNEDRGYFVPSVPVWRADDAQILHYPGRPLPVDDILDLPISVEKLRQAAGRSTVKVTHQELALLAKTLAKKTPEVGLALQRVLQGEPFAEHGLRDNMLFKLAGEIAKAFPNADASSIAIHFQASISHFGDADLNWVTEKIQRRQADALEVQEANEREAIATARQAIRDAFVGGSWEGRDTPYTQADLEAFAREGRCTPEEFKRRWIIQLQGSYYFWVGGRGYVGPYDKESAKLAVHSFLAPATTLGVRLTEITLQGEFLKRNCNDMALDYGTVCDSVVLDMHAQTSYFDLKHRTLHRAPCPLRDLKPEFHPQIHQWLQLFAGVEYHNLELWLSWITALDRPAVALFCEGSPGSGKSLLAKGVARLWTKNAPTSLEQALSQFNDSLANCPLVFADEVLPKDFRGKGRTGELREFIQSDQRAYKRKFLPDATLKGCARVIIAANNRSALEGEENLTANDVAAIVGRFLHIETKREAFEFLRFVGTEGWVTDDLIAKHVLWIVHNLPKPTTIPRFLVESPGGKLTRTMATSTIMGSAITHWVVSFLLAPEKLRGGRAPGDSAHLIRVARGKVHINPRVLTDHWDRYATNVPIEKATAKAVMMGIRGLSDTQPDERVALSTPGYTHRNRPKFYALRTEDLIEWATGGYSSSEEILLAIQRLEEIDAKALDFETPPGV